MVWWNTEGACKGPLISILFGYAVVRRKGCFGGGKLRSGEALGISDRQTTHSTAAFHDRKEHRLLVDFFTSQPTDYHKSKASSTFASFLFMWIMPTQYINATTFF